MSCVYCAPKSSIRMRCAWMSGRAAALPPGAAPITSGALAMTSGHPVVGCFLGDADVVYVTLAYAGAGDTHEHRPRAQLGDVAAAGIAHRGTPPPGEVPQDRD